MNGHLLQAIIAWTDGAERVDETRKYLEATLRDEATYRERMIAQLLLAGTNASASSRGLDEGETSVELRDALQAFERIVDEDARHGFDFLNAPKGDIERIPVRTTLEQFDALNAMIAENLTRSDDVDDAIEYLDARIRPLLRLDNPPILYMLVAQARAHLRRAISDRPDDPGDSGSSERAIECAVKAREVAGFYEDSPAAREQLEWAEELLRRAGRLHVENPREAEDAKTQSRCFIASAALGEDDAIVETLRAWRDSRLRSSIHGRQCIHMYEILSPPVARAIAKNPRTRAFVRALIVYAAQKFARR